MFCVVGGWVCGVPSTRSLATLLGALTLFLLTGAGVARGADRVYWADEGSGSNTGAIRFGNLDGSGTPQNIGANYASASDPFGVAIDPAIGRIYWADSGLSAIRVGNLDGSGSPQNLGANYGSEVEPSGIAVDPAAGKIYWADESSGQIRVGNLDGSGAPQTLFGGENNPAGVAIDPAAGKIYWTDRANPGAIRVGNLDGNGSPQNLGANYAAESRPLSLAIDPAGGKIYWADEDTGTIRVGNLDGSSSPQDLGANYHGEANPIGVAIDPAAGKIYWAADENPGAIRVGNLDGSGSPQNLGAAYASENEPDFPVLLRAPSATALPTVTGGSKAGSTLSCSRGQWAADLVGAFLYRAPSSFSYQWSRGGSTVPGATSSSITASKAGSYSCEVTATNAAGATSQTSTPFTVQTPAARIVKAKISSKRHSAMFSFKASGPSGFQCALLKPVKGNKKKHGHPKPHFSHCKSPKTYKHLKPGRYTFRVRALSGGVLGRAVSKSFKIA